MKRSRAGSRKSRTETGDARRHRDARGPAVTGRRAAAAAAGEYIYYLQAGAFRDMSDAENTRAKLALLGFEAAISDRTATAACCTACASARTTRSKR
jgi:cell division protein FtsN